MRLLRHGGRRRRRQAAAAAAVAGAAAVAARLPLADRVEVPLERLPPLQQRQQQRNVGGMQRGMLTRSRLSHNQQSVDLGNNALDGSMPAVEILGDARTRLQSRYASGPQLSASTCGK